MMREKTPDPSRRNALTEDAVTRSSAAIFLILGAAMASWTSGAAHACAAPEGASFTDFADCLVARHPDQGSYEDLTRALRGAGFGPLGAPQSAPWRNTRQVWIRPPVGGRPAVYAEISIDATGATGISFSPGRYPSPEDPE